MKILRATHLGMCFGVRDAIALALKQSEPTTILGDLVHNDLVLQQLRSKGVSIQHQVAEVSTRHVMITAHGTSQRRLDEVRARGHTVVEATCPLVHSAHRALRDLVRQGYHPVIIGRSNHVEVLGMTGDLSTYDVVLQEDEVAALQPRSHFGVIAQTTQPIDRVHRLVDLIRNQFPAADVRFVDTVCHPTKMRQQAAVDLARQCDLVIVIGGAHSNNTRELFATCQQHCSRVYHVQSSADLHGTWFAGAQTIGLTAGTSTPDEIINAVENWLAEFAKFQAKLAQDHDLAGPCPPVLPLPESTPDNVR